MTPFMQNVQEFLLLRVAHFVLVVCICSASTYRFAMHLHDVFQLEFCSLHRPAAASNDPRLVEVGQSSTMYGRVRVHFQLFDFRRFV